MGGIDFTPMAYMVVGALGGAVGLFIALIAWAFGASAGWMLAIIGGCAVVTMVAFKIGDAFD